MNIFKRIWNFFRPEKKKVELGCDGLPKGKKMHIVRIDKNKICRYCLGQKQMLWKDKMINCQTCEGTGYHTEWDIIEDEKIESPEHIRSKIIKPHTQLFNSQQLPGKIYNIGKSRFRIKKKSGESGEKLKYDIQLLT